MAYCRVGVVTALGKASLLSMLLCSLETMEFKPTPSPASRWLVR